MARPSIAERVLKGLEEARDHAAGKEVQGLVEHVPKDIDVAAIRKKTNLSQAAFANMIAVKLPTLRNWEQGRRTPEGPARVLLTMVNKKPNIVVSTLAPKLAAAKSTKAPAKAKLRSKKAAKPQDAA